MKTTKKTSIWSEFVAYRPVVEGASGALLQRGISWSDVGLYESMIGMGAGEVLVDPGGPAVEMLVCMGPVIGRDAGGAPVWSD